MTIPKGPNHMWWKGGRSVSSNGYMLIRVGVKHHLADVRGYAYEHRLVAEQKIGRRLKKGEQVHHIDGDRLNNSLVNLEVCSSIAHHREKHRKPRVKQLRKVGERNPLIECSCGCGESLRKYDGSNRPRSFVSGHNPSPSPAQDAVLSVLSGSPMSPREIIGKTSLSKTLVSVILSKLKSRGEVVKVSHGQWRKA